MDTPKHGSPLPQLPADLDNPAALDGWYSEWNAWIANEAAKPKLALVKTHDAGNAARDRGEGKEAKIQHSPRRGARGIICRSGRLATRSKRISEQRTRSMKRNARCWFRYCNPFSNIYPPRIGVSFLSRHTLARKSPLEVPRKINNWSWWKEGMP